MPVYQDMSINMQVMPAQQVLCLCLTLVLALLFDKFCSLWHIMLFMVDDFRLNWSQCM